MASLTRGTSFRRQGSSGSTWTYNEDGVLVRLKRDQVSIGHFTGGGSLSKVHHDPMVNAGRVVSSEAPQSSSSSSSSTSQQQQAEGGDSTMALNVKKQGQLETIEVMLERSKSVGSVPNKGIGNPASIKVLPHTHRSRSKVIKWLKKTLIKLKN